jgi:ankyrin repeat protein
MEIEKAELFMTWLFNIWDAVREGMIPLVHKYIKEQSYDVNQQRPVDLKTPLHIAVLRKNLDMVKTLIYYGADTTIKDNTD